MHVNFNTGFSEVNSASAVAIIELKYAMYNQFYMHLKKEGGVQLSHNYVLSLYYQMQYYSITQ